MYNLQAMKNCNDQMTVHLNGKNTKKLREKSVLYCAKKNSNQQHHLTKIFATKIFYLKIKKEPDYTTTLFLHYHTFKDLIREVLGYADLVLG